MIFLYFADLPDQFCDLAQIFYNKLYAKQALNYFDTSLLPFRFPFRVLSALIADVTSGIESNRSRKTHEYS